MFPFSLLVCNGLQKALGAPSAGQPLCKKPPPLRAGRCRRGGGFRQRIRRVAALHLAFGCTNSSTEMKCCQLSDEGLYGVIKLCHKCEQSLNKRTPEKSPVCTPCAYIRGLGCIRKLPNAVQFYQKGASAVLHSLAFHKGVQRSCALHLHLFGELFSILDFSDTP